jgi:hypothetical protein
MSQSGESASCVFCCILDVGAMALCPRCPLPVLVLVRHGTQGTIRYRLRCGVSADQLLKGEGGLEVWRFGGLDNPLVAAR